MKTRRAEIRGRRSEAVEGRASTIDDRGLSVEGLIQKAYSKALAEHGELGLAFEDFAAKLSSILAKPPRPKKRANRREGDSPKTLNDLHTDDLYLTTACADGSERAWERFAALYGNHIANVAHSMCSSHQQARDVASSMLGHLYLRDRSGQRRIGSYDGSGSLRSWLAMIIKYQSINQDQLNSKETVQLDSLRNEPDPESISALEARLLESEHLEAFMDSFKASVEALTPHERLVLALRFLDGIPAKKIARMDGVHPSQITRTIKQARGKFRQAALARLKTQHGLDEAAVEECASKFLDGKLAGTLCLSISGFVVPESCRARVACVA